MNLRNIFKKKPSAEKKEEWLFDQGPNVAAITSTHITKEGKPILQVTHYGDDDSWGFQPGFEILTEDGQVVAMKTIVDLDPTVQEIADLPPGWSADRTEVGGRWTKSKDEFEPDEA